MTTQVSPEQPQRVALVTGAAKRIGREIALALARRGWDVAVHYGQSANEAASLVTQIQALGRRAVALQCELSDADAVRGLLARAESELGPVQCLVNNASLFEQDTAQNFSPASLDRHMQVNLTAPLLLARALYAATAPQQQACVINLLDQKLCNLNPDYLSYTLSKSALQCATVTLAQAFAPRLRVVGISPGISLQSGAQSEAEFALAHQQTPLGRSSTAQDIADTVCFVADARAITGTTILVDGGQHLIPLQRDVMFLSAAQPTSSL